VATEAAPLERAVTKISTEFGVMIVGKNQAQVPAGLFYLHLSLSR
jgi:hypothetical protein